MGHKHVNDTAISKDVNCDEYVRASD